MESSAFRGVDVHYQMSRLSNARSISPQEAEAILRTFASEAARSYDAVAELLAHLTASRGGLAPLAFGFFSQSEAVREAAVDLFNALRAYDVGRVFIRLLNHFQRYDTPLLFPLVARLIWSFPGMHTCALRASGRPRSATRTSRRWRSLRPQARRWCARPRTTARARWGTRQPRRLYIPHLTCPPAGLLLGACLRVKNAALGILSEYVCYNDSMEQRCGERSCTASRQTYDIHDVVTRTTDLWVRHPTTKSETRHWE